MSRRSQLWSLARFMSEISAGECALCNERRCIIVHEIDKRRWMLDQCEATPPISPTG